MLLSRVEEAKVNIKEQVLGVRWNDMDETVKNGQKARSQELRTSETLWKVVIRYGFIISRKCWMPSKAYSS